MRSKTPSVSASRSPRRNCTRPVQCQTRRIFLRELQSIRRNVYRLHLRFGATPPPGSDAITPLPVPTSRTLSGFRSPLSTIKNSTSSSVSGRGISARLSATNNAPAKLHRAEEMLQRLSLATPSHQFAQRRQFRLRERLVRSPSKARSVSVPARAPANARHSTAGFRRPFLEIGGG